MKTLVLIGGGHSHVEVLKQFGMAPLPGVQLILICRDTHTPYSGMLPGLVAGHYAYDDVHIDLRRLAGFAGARFYGDEVTGFDFENQKIFCKSRPPVPYDLCSVNIGSAPGLGQIPGAAENVSPVKPISGFLDQWRTLQHRVGVAQRPLRIGIVGAGAAGVELALAMEHAFSACSLATSQQIPEFHLFSQNAKILPTHGAKAQRYLLRSLLERGILLHLGEEVVSVARNSLTTQSCETYVLDAVLWTTAARPPAWLEETGLDLTGDGFIEVNDFLQSTSHGNVFAAGDVATMINHPREKAGVMAVRHGPPLARNLRRILIDAPLKKFRPQKTWLSLISTGDRRAVASWGHFAAQGKLMWRWKDWIDRRFMAKFGDLPDMALKGQRGDVLEKDEADDMRCGGCGAKISPAMLARVLARLRAEAEISSLVLPQALDDAAAVSVPPGQELWQSVDFFRSFIDDPLVFGRIAAVHALGDIYAMGAVPVSAQALAVVPYGRATDMEEDLFLMLAGAMEVLSVAGAQLIGGHSAEGEALELGFAVNGVAATGTALRKGGMVEGDALILTKPLGTGTLMAANMRGRAKGRWIDAALKTMAQTQGKAAEIFLQSQTHACTDITGFGIAGHVAEMMQASGYGAEIALDALPVMDGALVSLAAKIFSTLHPENARAKVHIANADDFDGQPRYDLLFDPQTAGGLLGAVPSSCAGTCLEQLHAAGYENARIIGWVTARAQPPVLMLTNSGARL